MLVTQNSSDRRSVASGVPPTPKVECLLASLGPQPINPTQGKLVSSVSTFPTCNALLGNLRKVGATHVGSRGFGGFCQYANYTYLPVQSEVVTPYGPADQAGKQSSMSGDAIARAQPSSGGTTLGTNVQVAGIDELDSVKAEGKFIYDLDGKGKLRITDAKSLDVLATLDVTPPRSSTSGDNSGPDFAPGHHLEHGRPRFRHADDSQLGAQGA